ncbi:sorbosone dehydrogenase family protein, partial [Massilia arenosa]
ATPARAGSWSEDAPGKVHRFTVADLPQPFSSASAGNGPKLAARPDNALPKVPDNFSVTAYAKLPARGRLLIRAPNGDLFLSIPATGEIRQVRPDGTTTVFATGLTRPYGMAFYPAGPNPRYLYVANVNSVVRIPYTKGDTKARTAAETVVDKLAGTSGGHTTRSLQFSKDGKTMFVSVGSASNVAEEIPRKPDVPLAQWERQHGLGAAWGDEEDRALVLAFDPDGKHKRTFATGLRNCVGLLVHPDTGDLFCGVNERDALGDNIPFEYLTTVRQGAFYGWPWYYIGGHEDPRLAGVRPDLKDKVTTPDLLIQAHSAPLGLTVYHAPQGAQHAFPKDYDGDIFLALHGSWNRGLRTGYKVVRVRMKDGKPAGQYEDFMTGMVLNDNEVWGRPAAVTVAADGALLVVDDGSNTIWRVAPR